MLKIEVGYNGNINIADHDRLLYSVHTTLGMYSNKLLIKIKNHNMFRPSM
jgi:hypothetical protein